MTELKDPTKDTLASIDAVRLVLSFRSGNTKLLRHLMMGVSETAGVGADLVFPDGAKSWVKPAVLSLVEAGCAVRDDARACYLLLWEVLEDRTNKPMTWEQAVRQCVTDPAEIEHLLAMDDEPLSQASDTEGGEAS